MLQQISYDSTNTASVLIFSNICQVRFKNADPKKIDVDQIKFPGGGTSPNPAFLKAAEIIR